MRDTGPASADTVLRLGDIVANLDCENAWAGRVPGDISPRAAARIGALATLLRVFARSPLDCLWTPSPVDPVRMAPVPGVPRPRLASGPIELPETRRPVLAWGETPAVASLRGARSDVSVVGTGRGDAVWSWPSPSPEVAALVNHRAWALDVARRLGVDLPGARMISGLGELAAHLADAGAAASPEGMWVVKSPWSAAGRDRLIGRGPDVADEELRRGVERLFRRHGPLLFEPWMHREADFGVCASAGGADGASAALLHRQLVDGRGRFLGIELTAGSSVNGATPPGMTADERDRTIAAAVEVGRSLASEGYRGPFGVDAWRYRDRDGRIAFQPIGEINARLTFGWVARAWADRIAALRGWDDERTRVVRLRLGRGWPPDAVENGVVLPLLWPGETDPSAAWLEIIDGIERSPHLHPGIGSIPPMLPPLPSLGEGG